MCVIYWYLCVFVSVMCVFDDVGVDCDVVDCVDDVGCDDVLMVCVKGVDEEMVLLFWMCFLCELCGELSVEFIVVCLYMWWEIDIVFLFVCKVVGWMMGMVKIGRVFTAVNERGCVAFVGEEMEDFGGEDEILRDGDVMVKRL